MDRIRQTEEPFIKRKTAPFRVGDTVDVHLRILEEIIEGEAAGAKKQAGKKKVAEKRERIQVFSGVVIADKHEGLRRTFTVRRIVQGEGVERIFPLNSPAIAKIEVKKSARVLRAKLYYLRNLAGRKARLTETRAARKFGELLSPPPETPGADTPPKGPGERASPVPSPAPSTASAS